jgi:glycosyltransferase involved in cell wall biosynthesis
VPADKITVARNGVDPRFRPMSSSAGPQIESLRRRLGLPLTFILHVGTIEPRKNLTRLIEAYGLLLSDMAAASACGRGQAPDARPEALALVLVGRRGWLYDPIVQAAERVNTSGGRVIFLDYVYDDQLPLLYNMAAVFAYPSLYEGFGLPAAEALACGVPTLVSNDGALAEVVGDAALVVDPRSVEQIAAGLKTLLMDHDLRTRLAAAGPAQVAGLTWQASARTVLDVYHRVAT